MNETVISPLVPVDRPRVRKFLVDHWSDARMVSRGKVHQADMLPGFKAVRDGKLIGLVTYHIDGNECEIVSLDSTEEGRGVGTALMAPVVDKAETTGCTRVWLITTNNNEHAQQFYKNRGFKVANVHYWALSRSRELKPSIPLEDENGVPIRDEIEMELVLH